MLRRRRSEGERALAAALRPWQRRLHLLTVVRWLLIGAIGALALADLVLLVGWVVPQPEAELRPWAAQLGAALLAGALVLGAWPRPRLRYTVDLDSRLRLGDRITTAWAFRHSSEMFVKLQRSDTIGHLTVRAPREELIWRISRWHVGGLVGAFVLLVALTVTPSPQQAVLDQQAAEQLALQQTSDRLEALRQDATSAATLTPEQARQLDELLRQAQAELSRVRSQQEATAALQRAQEQLTQQLGDPNAELRDEALAAMSETLAAEPQTRALASALEREDSQAASDALQALAAGADQLSDIERQALGRALQRAANVGRSEPRTSAALRQAAQAVASGEPASGAFSATESALRDAMQASAAQASLNSTAERLRQLQARLSSGVMPRPDADEFFGSGEQASGPSSNAPTAGGTPIALDASGGAASLRDPSTGPGKGAGTDGAQLSSAASGAVAGGAAENVFVPGRIGNGPTDQDLVEQPFTVRGAPRPYRDVLSDYAQTSRDYVDRPDVSPAVRDLVKQYFQELEEGE